VQLEQLGWGTGGHKILYLHIGFKMSPIIYYLLLLLLGQEAFQKCWAHSPLRAAVTLPFTRCRCCRTYASYSAGGVRCPRQRMTEGTAMGPINHVAIYWMKFYLGLYKSFTTVFSWVSTWKIPCTTRQ